MILLFWGLTLSLIGKVMLVVGVLLAHSKIAHEHRIDNAVIHSFRIEKILTIIGLLLLLVGYLLEIFFYGFTPFFECPLSDCAAQLGSLLSH